MQITAMLLVKIYLKGNQKNPPKKNYEDQRISTSPHTLVDKIIEFNLI